jgi:hypothetical protein
VPCSPPWTILPNTFESFNKSFKPKKWKWFTIRGRSFETFGKKIYKCFSFITSTFKSCKTFMNTSNTLIDNKRVETLKHTSLHGPTIVVHSTLRLKGNSLKQINLCKCDAKIKFEGCVYKEPIHFKMGKWHKTFLQTSGWNEHILYNYTYYYGCKWVFCKDVIKCNASSMSIVIAPIYFVWGCIMSYDLDLCPGFLLCECDLKKARWTPNPNGWFVVLDVTSRKC